MSVVIYSNTLCNWAASHHVETQTALRRLTREVEGRARGNLAAVRASTGWHKIHGPDHLTRVTAESGGVDHYVILEAPNPMAIEFGHAPSGVFAGTPTRAPHGLYILTAAAGLGKSTAVSSGGRKKGTYRKRDGMYRKQRKRKRRK